MRRETAVIAVVVGLALLPMWYVGLHGEPPAEEVEIDQSVSDIRPLAGPVDAPTKLSPSQVGVIVWVAMLAMIGVLVAAHRFMNEAVRPVGDGASRESGVADGGYVDSYPWLATEKRWLVEHHEPAASREGLVVMGGLTVFTLAFAALLVGEYLTLARTQYFGIYAAGMFFSLAMLTVAYYAWFLPHIHVAEQR